MVWIIGVIAAAVLYYWVGLAGIFIGLAVVVVFVGVVMAFIFVSAGISHRKKCRADGLPVGSLWHHIKLAQTEFEEDLKQKKAIEQEAAKLEALKQKAIEQNVSQSTPSFKAFSESLKSDRAQPASGVSYAIVQHPVAVKIASPEPVQPPKKSAPKRPSSAVRKADGLPDRITFLYENAEGEMAMRDVNVHKSSCNANGDYYIEGYCKERRANRTFRIDRMIGMITRHATGEVLSADAWLKQVARIKPAMAPAAKIEEQSTRVTFTGFKKLERAKLEAQAKEVGWHVMKTVSPTLDYLVCGDNAGPTKIRDAEALYIEVIDEDDFLALIESEAEV